MFEFDCFRHDFQCLWLVFHLWMILLSGVLFSCYKFQEHISLLFFCSIIIHPLRYLFSYAKQMMQVELHGVNTTEEFKMKIKQAVESKLILRT